MKEKRAKLAAKRREQLLAQMANAQKNFLSSNSEMFDQIDDQQANNENMSMEWQLSQPEESKSNACIGLKRKNVIPEIENYTCILCSEESTNNNNQRLVYPAFIQKSSVLSRFQVTNDNGQLQSLETAIHPSPHIATCGHVMHTACWQEYFNNEKLKESRRPFRNRTPTIFNIDKNEFLCPLCLFLSNAVLPLIAPLSNLYDMKTNPHDKFNFESWSNLMTEFFKNMQGISEYDPSTETEFLGEEFENKFDANMIDFLTEKYNFVFEKDLSIIAHRKLDLAILENADDFLKTITDIVSYPVASKSIEKYVTVWLSCAYSVEALEMYMRATGKSLKNDMSIRFTKCVSGLVRLCGVIGPTFINHNKTDDVEEVHLTGKYYHLLSYARDLYKRVFCKSPECVLQWDIFGLLVSLVFTTRVIIFPKHASFVIPRGDSLEHTIFTCMFVTNLVKVLLTLDLKELGTDIDMDSEEVAGCSTEESQTNNSKELDDVSNRLLFLYEKYNIYLNIPESGEPENSGNKKARIALKNRLLEEIKTQSQTFLRCSCILFRFLTDIEFPEDFDESFKSMVDYLNIDDDLLVYFNDASLYNFMLNLVQHKEVENYRKLMASRLENSESSVCEVVPIMTPRAQIRQLVALPDDYSDLINSVSNFTCRNNHREDSRNPTMCLVCGEILCSQTYCCQKELQGNKVGPCTYHTEICGAGAGIFLRMRDAEILLLGQNKGAFMSAPYLDDYGETDQGLRRGNPLHLCRESYEKLHLLWLSHGIHEEIARKTESQTHMYQVQWTHL